MRRQKSGCILQNIVGGWSLGDLVPRVLRRRRFAAAPAADCGALLSNRGYGRKPRRAFRPPVPRGEAEKVGMKMRSTKLLVLFRRGQRRGLTFGLFAQRGLLDARMTEQTA